MGPNFNDLIKALSSPDETDRCYALEDLETSDNDVEIVPFIVSSLQDKSARVRETAVEILVRIGGLDVAEATAVFLSSENVSLRNSVVEILEKLGENSLYVLKKYTSDNSPDVRKFALDIISKIVNGKPGLLEQVRNEVLDRLDDHDPNVAGAAAEVLGLAGDERSIPELVNHIFCKNQSSWLQCNVIVALFRISPKSAAEQLKGIDKHRLSNEALTYLNMGLGGEIL